MIFSKSPALLLFVNDQFFQTEFKSSVLSTTNLNHSSLLLTEWFQHWDTAFNWWVEL